jgi:hypothetical protein
MSIQNAPNKRIPTFVTFVSSFLSTACHFPCFPLFIPHIPLDVFQVTIQLEVELNNIKKLQHDLKAKDELLKAADDEKAQLREEKNQLEAVSEV